LSLHQGTEGHKSCPLTIPLPLFPLVVVGRTMIGNQREYLA
jgi:hypothetical protein